MDLKLLATALSANNVTHAKLDANTVALSVQTFDPGTGQPIAPMQTLVNKATTQAQRDALAADLAALDALLAMFA